MKLRKNLTLPELCQNFQKQVESQLKKIKKFIKKAQIKRKKLLV